MLDSSFIFSTDLMNILLLNKTDILKKQQLIKKDHFYLWSLKLQGHYSLSFVQFKIKKEMLHLIVCSDQKNKSQ